MSSSSGHGTTAVPGSRLSDCALRGPLTLFQLLFLLVRFLLNVLFRFGLFL